MMLTDGVISLSTLGYDAIDEENLVLAWNEISRVSAESIAADSPGIFDFADRCFVFFVIQHTVKEKSKEKHFHQLCPNAPTLYQGTLRETVGIVYLTGSHLPSSVNIGISLLPEARTIGLGKRAAGLALQCAFNELRCHRVHAQIVDVNPDFRDITLGLFTGLGFSHEGTSRRALFCPANQKLSERFPHEEIGEWKDIINLAMLETDWALREVIVRMPRDVMKSRWDDLFARQDRERHNMLLLEEREEQRRRERESAQNAPEPGVQPVHLEPSLAPAARWSNSWDTHVPSPEQGLTLEDCHAVPEMPIQSLPDDWRSTTPTPQERNSSSPSSSPSPPPRRNSVAPLGRVGRASPYGGGLRRRRPRVPRAEEAWETSSTSSSSTSSSAVMYDCVENPFSDPESVPGSPSVASTASWSSVDTWEMLDLSAPNSSAEATDEE